MTAEALNDVAEQSQTVWLCQIFLIIHTERLCVIISGSVVMLSLRAELSPLKNVNSLRLLTVERTV